MVNKDRCANPLSHFKCCCVMSMRDDILSRPLISIITCRRLGRVWWTSLVSTCRTFTPNTKRRGRQGPKTEKDGGNGNNRDQRSLS